MSELNLRDAKVLVSGGTGLVGSQLCGLLASQGAKVARLSRQAKSGDPMWFQWNPETKQIPREALQDATAVIHLAGDNIAEGRWNLAKKQRIRESRVRGTQLLAQAIADANPKPAVFVSASAIGFYGNRGDEVVSELSLPGPGFLPEVCTAWEQATSVAEQAGVRTVKVRIGVVLSTRGGALAKMLTPFRLGGGGVIGNGKQYMSWIAIDDLCAVLVHCVRNPEISGPVNGVAPHPATNREFTKALGAAVHRPTLLPMPGFVAKLAFGEMADDLLLGSTRVECRRLRESGFQFKHGDIGPALEHVLASKI